jgi:aspartate-semialdehyde dehydrogenase
MAETTFDVAVVGATGAVGVEVYEVLKARAFPVGRLRLFASARSAGKVVPTPYGDVTIEEFSVAAVRETAFAFLAVSGSFALEHAHALAAPGGPVVIDNSSAFRMDPNVPLVVPEVNASAIGDARLVANPNCTTAIAAMALYPVRGGRGGAGACGRDRPILASRNRAGLVRHPRRHALPLALERERACSCS